MTTFTTEDRIAAEEDEVVPIPFAGMVSLKPLPEVKSLEDLARDESDKRATWTCPRCSDVIPSDVVHNCPRWLDAVNEDEARYNERNNRAGARWAGD